MRSQDVAAAFLALLSLSAALWFVLDFEETIHCTQKTSFRIALFDMEPHVEERLGRVAPLPAYTHPTAVPIRVGAAIISLAVILTPPVALLGVIPGWWRRRVAALTSLTVWLVGLAVSQASGLLGERLQSLVALSVLFSLLLAPASGLGLALSLRRPDEALHLHKVSLASKAAVVALAVAVIGRRLVVVVQQGGLDSPDDPGSPVAFLLGFGFELLLFVGGPVVVVLILDLIRRSLAQKPPPRSVLNDPAGGSSPRRQGRRRVAT